MNRLPNREETHEKQVASENRNRFLKNHKISYVLITLAVLVVFGLLCYWLKNSGVIFSI